MMFLKPPETYEEQESKGFSMIVVGLKHDKNEKVMVHGHLWD